MTAVIRQTPELRPEPRVCADCGEPIMPGQLYLVGEPLHVYCGRARAADAGYSSGAHEHYAWDGEEEEL